MVHAADKAERHQRRLLRQDNAKPWSKESAAIKIDDLPLREVRGLLTLDGLVSGCRTEQAAALSFGIRLLAKPTPRQPALRNSGMFSGVTPPMAT